VPQRRHILVSACAVSSALLDACRAAGYRVTDAEVREGESHAYVEDPFGNRIELLELT